MQTLIRRFRFQYWYFRQPPWDTGISPPELLEFIQTHPPGRALDLGCGTGTNVLTLARVGWDVTGVDFAPRAIKLARRKACQAGLQAELLVRDVTRLHGISGPFEFALDLGCFHGIPQTGRRKYMQELDRVLAPNGFWLMYGFLKADPDSTETGLAVSDLERVSTFLTLLWRRDGFDQRERSSAWFLFQKGSRPVE